MKAKLAAALVSLLVLEGCSSPGEPTIRPVAEGPSLAPGNALLAIAEGHFRQGNYALAAHEYRRVLRHSPDLVAAYNGLAASYDQMGRYDLSERYYQEALARAPHDRAVRHNLALSLEIQNRRTEARLLALEGAALGLAPMPVNAAQIGPLVPRIAQIDRHSGEAAPSPRRLERLSAGEVALITSEDSPLAIDHGTRLAADTVRPDRVSRGPEGPTWRWRIADAQPDSRRASWQSILRSVAGLLAANESGQAGRTARAVPPRELRMTMDGPVWSWRIERTDPARIADLPVQVLNAVGRRGQAARMRRHLRSAGWQEIAIGDAADRRARSAIRHSRDRRDDAARLAAELPFPVELQESRSAALTLVLGRNAVTFDRQLQAALIS